MISRLIPRSLGAQLLVMLLLALGVSQGLSLLVFSDERDRAVRTALGFEAAGRAANVAHLLGTASGTSRTQIVAAASSPLVRFWIDPEPAVAKTELNDIGIVSRVRSALGDPSREVRVDIGVRSQPLMGVDEVPLGMRQMHAAMLAESTGPEQLTLSIRLASGAWLNVRSMFHRPVAQWLAVDVVALALAAALITLVAVLTAVRVVRPMRALADAADHAGRGDALPALRETGPREIRHTLRAFNTMQERITRYVDDRTRMLAALSHDLRSPLTAMRLRLELIEEGEDRDRLSALADEMQALVESTLAFARGESEKEDTTKVDLVSILNDLVSDNHHLSIASPPTLITYLRPVMLKRALRNLIDNAIRYGDRANIELTESGEYVLIHITDQGPGLPEDQLEAVFEPFHRYETSRSRDTGGAGLGLAIARSAIRAHGGDISLENKPEGGLVATVRLPR